MSGETVRTLGEIPKSARESIRVTLKERGGDLRCDLRISTSDARGVRQETGRGLSVPVSRLRDVIRALEEAARLAGQPDG